MSAVERRHEWVTSLSDVELQLTLERTIEESQKQIKNDLDLNNLKFMFDLLTDEKARRLLP